MTCVFNRNFLNMITTAFVAFCRVHAECFSAVEILLLLLLILLVNPVQLWGRGGGPLLTSPFSSAYMRVVCYVLKPGAGVPNKPQVHTPLPCSTVGGSPTCRITTHPQNRGSKIFPHVHLCAVRSDDPSHAIWLRFVSVSSTVVIMRVEIPISKFASDDVQM